jgi:hypothetical protein
MVIAFVTPIPAYMIRYALVGDNPALVAGGGSGFMSASPDGAFKLVGAASVGFNEQGVNRCRSSVTISGIGPVRLLVLAGVAVAASVSAGLHPSRVVG